MAGRATIVRADARALPLADNTVDLVVTSPPYFALRSYQDGGEHYAGQIGDEPTPAAFVDSLLEVTRECMRVLKPSGSLWVNLGDKYAQPGKGERNRNGAGSGAVPEIGSHFLRSAVGQSYGGIKGKSLMMIPARYAIRCIDELGLILRAEVIWSKPNGLPESVTDRVRRSHEQWFHLTLNPRYYSAVDEIREAAQDRGPALSWAGRKDRGDPPRYGEQRVATDGAGLGVNPLGKLPGSVWEIPTEPLKVPESLGVDHFAAFPTEWPRRIIQGWSPAGVCTACGEGRRPLLVSQRPGGGKLWDRSGRGIVDRVRRMHDERTEREITGYACACTPWHMEARPTDRDPDNEVTVYDWHLWDAAPTTPAVVLDPFGGTGTTALVAKALGRHGISIDMSADYCRLAEWRTTDPAQLAKAMRVEKPRPQVDGQSTLFEVG